MRGHNEGTIWHNRKRGLYIVKVSLPDGRRLERSSVDRNTAKAHLKEMLRLVGKGIEPKPRLTVAVFLDAWLSDVKTSVRPSTYSRYESVVRVHLVPGIGFLRLQSLRPSVVDKFLATKAGRTAQLCREVGRNAMNAALRDVLVEYNAFERAHAVHHEAKLPAILSPAELGRLLEGTADDRLHALFVLAGTTGMREAELLGLAWSDLDWKAGTLTVNSQLVRLTERQCGVKGGLWKLADPKTRKGHRTIRIPKVALEALRAHQRAQMTGKADRAYPGLAFVTAEEGMPLYGYRVVDMLRGHLDRLKITTPHPLKLHELRHGLASYMKDDGVPDQVLADYLGHSTTRLIERYAHALAESDGMVAAAMTRRLG